MKVRDNDGIAAAPATRGSVDPDQDGVARSGAMANGDSSHDLEGPYSLREWFRDLGNMLKAFIGLNFMFVSFAFSNAGLIRGTVGLLVILYMTEFCCHLLIKVKDLMPEARDHSAVITYGDVTRFALGDNAQRVVNFFLILTQFGFCVGYLIFLSQTVHDLLQSSAPVWSFVLVPLPVLSTLALLRSIRSLAFTSNIANFSLLIGFVAVTTYIIVHFKFDPATPSILSFPLFFGQMTAALEGIALVLPIQISMTHKSQFPLVLRVALIIMGSVLLTVGILGMATFGDETRSIILLNMQGSHVVNTVKVILCLGILFTYPLQLVPVLQALEGWLQGNSISETHILAHDIGGAGFESGNLEQLNMEDQWTSENGIIARSPVDLADGGFSDGSPSVDQPLRDMQESSDGFPGPPPPPRKRTFVRDWRSILGRLMIVLGTAVVAIGAGKSFGLFQSLVGSLGAASLAYTMPPLLYMKMFRRDMSPTQIAAYWGIFAFGVAGAILGTAVSVYEITRPGGGELSSR